MRKLKKFVCDCLFLLIVVCLVGNLVPQVQGATQVNLKPQVMLLTYRDKSIPPLLYSLGTPFDWRDITQFSPAYQLKYGDLFDETGLPKHDIIFAIPSTNAEGNLVTGFKNWMLWLAGNGSTVFLDGQALNIFKNELNITYGYYSSWTYANITFSDGYEVIGDRYEGISNSTANANFTGTIYATAEIGNLNDRLVLAEIPYGSGRFVIVGIPTIFGSEFWGMSNFSSKTFGIISQILNDKIPFRFSGWKYGKDIAFDIRYDDIWSLNHPNFVGYLKGMDAIIINHGMKATYGLTTLGAVNWNDTTTQLGGAVSLTSGFPSGHTGSPSSTTWYGNFTYANLSYIVYNSTPTSEIDQIKFDLNKNLNFSDETAYTINDTFFSPIYIPPYKLIWFSLNNYTSPAQITFWPANNFTEQYDSTFITYLKSNCENNGFRIVAHGLTHYLPEYKYPHPNETVNLPTGYLEERFTDAYNILINLFGLGCVDKFSNVPYGSCGENTNMPIALQDMGWYYGSHMFSSWLPPCMGAGQIDTATNASIRQAMEYSLNVSGYFIAFGHANANWTSRVDYLGNVYEEYEDRIWLAGEREIGNFTKNRTNMQDFNFSGVAPNLVWSGNNLTLEYWAPSGFKDYQIKVKRTVQNEDFFWLTVNKTFTIPKIYDDWVYINIQDSGPVKIEFSLTTTNPRIYETNASLNAVSYTSGKLTSVTSASSGTNSTTKIYIPSNVYTNDRFYVSTNASQWGYSWDSTSRILTIWAVAQSAIKLEVSKLPDDSSCSADAECLGGYCVNGYCKSSPYASYAGYLPECQREGRVCTERTPCCEDLSCTDNICKNVTLVPEEKISPVLKCPSCPECSDWSSCTENKQTRSCYNCSKATNYTCQAYTETKHCELPEIKAKHWYDIFLKWNTWIIIGVVVFIAIAVRRLWQPLIKKYKQPLMQNQWYSLICYP